MSHFLEDALGEPANIGQRRAFDEHRKLVAAEPRHGVALAHERR